MTASPHPADGFAVPTKSKAPSPINAAQTVSQAFAALLRHDLDQVLIWQDTARGWDDIEGVHQMRVGFRRMRSVLSLFRDAIPLLGETGRGQTSLVEEAGWRLTGVVRPRATGTSAAHQWNTSAWLSKKCFRFMTTRLKIVGSSLKHAPRAAGTWKICSHCSYYCCCPGFSPVRRLRWYRSRWRVPRR
jgi:hypothetical protein